jgi:ribosome-binding protein aMBF1 (putative translation factor)
LIGIETKAQYYSRNVRFENVSEPHKVPQDLRATLHQIDSVVLAREMREDAGLTKTELAKKVGTIQFVIARLEDAEYTGHSLTMLERIAAVCGASLKLHAEKKPHFDREVALV